MKPPTKFLVHAGLFLGAVWTLAPSMKMDHHSAVQEFRDSHENWMRSYMTYLAIDPGEKKTGWARFGEDGETTGFGTIDGIDEFLDWLDDQPKPRVVIMEDYRVSPTISHAFSKVRTIEVIGGVKRYCRKNNITLVEQRNLVLPIGLRYLGMYEVYYKGRKKVKHVDDEISALAHGEYYLVSTKVKKHRRDTSGDDVSN